jgi:hypothetical protein
VIVTAEERERVDELPVPPPPKPPRASARVGAWAKFADCIGRPEPFDDLRRTGEALRMCATCPVLRHCRDWALRNAVYGVAGGMQPAARARWRRTHRIPEPVVTIADFLPQWVVERDEAAQLLGGDAAFPAVPEAVTGDDVWAGAVRQGWGGSKRIMTGPAVQPASAAGS